ncbi:MAG: PASTA domain-containing protein [Oscillospiraceae bacterium]|nr:PASTA domain-containing protein [Oscillospiraceae bacterium]
MKTEDLLEEIGNVSQDLIADHALPDGASSEQTGRNAKKEIVMNSKQKSEYIKNPFIRRLPAVAAIAAVVVAAVVILPKLDLRGTQPPVPAASIEQEDESSSALDLTNGMPSLIGMSLDEVRAVLDDQLDIVVVSREYSSEEEGIIFDQDVVPGSPVQKGDLVNVKVSLGAKMVQLPDMKGWTYEMAKNEILRIGLFVDKRSAYDDTVPEGNVISTDPAGPIDLEPGSYVRMTVSLGPNRNTVAVPNFVGMDWDLAQTTAAGMCLKLEKTEVDDPAPAGTVLSQNIAVGEEVSEETVIELTIAKGAAEKEGALRISFTIPEGANGHYHIKMMKDGVVTSVSSAFNPENAAGVTSITVEGEGEADLVAVLVNDDTLAEATIGTYHVNYADGTSELKSGSIEEAFRQLNNGNE